jgi:purine-binding chemotaxis protein CheW
MTSPSQLCTFFLGDYLFGVDVQNVQEVIRYQAMTHVPLAPSTVRGLINLRGQIVTAIDMRVRLGMREPGRTDPMNVVVRTTDGVVSLLVDEIGDVIEVDDKTFERAPDTLTGPFRELVPGVYKLNGRLLLLLDVERVTTDDAASLREKAAA